MENNNNNDEEAPKKSKKGLVTIIIILVLAAVGGAVGYIGIGPLAMGTEKETVKLPDISETIFITLPKIVITLGENAQAKHLRAQFAIETEKAYEERIKRLEPRLMDVFNTYLRIVEEKELLNPERFQNLQAQMLRRARLVAGEPAIKNLLVQEFILQ